MSNGVICPACGSSASEVKDSRPIAGGIRRRRLCRGCGALYSTREAPMEMQPVRGRPRKTAAPKPKPRPVIIPDHTSDAEKIEQFIAQNGTRRFEPKPVLELVKAELESRGHTIRYYGQNHWVLDGKRVRWVKITAKVNKYRIQAGKEPLSL